MALRLQIRYIISENTYITEATNREWLLAGPIEHFNIVVVTVILARCDQVREGQADHSTAWYHNGPPAYRIFGEIPWEVGTREAAVDSCKQCSSTSQTWNNIHG